MTAFATALAAASATALAAWLARRRYLLVTVRGDSMAPTYVDGQRLLVRRGLAPRPSDVIVFRTPASVAGGPEGLKWLVKRVAACAGQPVPPEVRDRVAAGPAATIPEGCLVVRGDNPVSQDSRHFGYVLSSSVVGVALAEKKENYTPTTSTT